MNTGAATVNRGEIVSMYAGLYAMRNDNRRWFLCASRSKIMLMRLFVIDDTSCKINLSLLDMRLSTASVKP